jgi:hypothetical protein
MADEGAASQYQVLEELGSTCETIQRRKGPWRGEEEEEKTIRGGATRLTRQ